MATIILDKHAGSREYIAHAHVGGATRAAICDGLAAKYGIAAPTPRSLTKWLANDYELRRMISDLRSTIADDSVGELAQKVDIWRVDRDLWSMMHTDEGCEAFGDLVELGAVDDTAAGWTEPETDYYGNPISDPVPNPADAAAEDDVLAVLTAGHETAEAFEADCVARLAAHA
jgi:hypothetical protein